MRAAANGSSTPTRVHRGNRGSPKRPRSGAPDAGHFGTASAHRFESRTQSRVEGRLEKQSAYLVRPERRRPAARVSKPWSLKRATTCRATSDSRPHGKRRGASAVCRRRRRLALRRGTTTQRDRAPGVGEGQKPGAERFALGVRAPETRSLVRLVEPATRDRPRLRSLARGRSSSVGIRQGAPTALPYRGAATHRAGEREPAHCPRWDGRSQLPSNLGCCRNLGVLVSGC